MSAPMIVVNLDEVSTEPFPHDELAVKEWSYLPVTNHNAKHQRHILCTCLFSLCPSACPVFSSSYQLKTQLVITIYTCRVSQCWANT